MRFHHNRHPLLCFDVLIEVLDHFSLQDMGALNGVSRQLWRACAHSIHWQWAVQPRLISQITLISSGIEWTSPVKDPEGHYPFDKMQLSVVRGIGKRAEATRQYVVPLLDSDRWHPGKQLRQSQLPLCPPPRDLSVDFSRVHLEIPHAIRNTEVYHFLACIADRLADHTLVFDAELTFAGCCNDTVPMYQLINVFSQRGLHALILTLEPARFQHCSGSRRSDELGDWLATGAALLVSPAVLKTPTVWLRVLPLDFMWAYRPRRSRRRRSFRQRLSRLLHLSQHQEAFRLPRDDDEDLLEVNLFEPRLIEECHAWLHAPLPAEREGVFLRMLHIDATVLYPYDYTPWRLSLSNVEGFIDDLKKRFMTEGETNGDDNGGAGEEEPGSRGKTSLAPASWAIVFTVPRATLKVSRKQPMVNKNQPQKGNREKKAPSTESPNNFPRPVPFRLENPATGDCLSLWHCSSPPESLPFPTMTWEQAINRLGNDLKKFNDYFSVFNVPFKAPISSLFPSPSSPSSPTQQRRQHSAFVLQRHPMSGPLAPLFDRSSSASHHSLFASSNSGLKARVVHARRFHQLVATCVI